MKPLRGLPLLKKETLKKQKFCGFSVVFHNNYKKRKTIYIRSKILNAKKLTQIKKLASLKVINIKQNRSK